MAKRTCVIPGCDKYQHGRGWCDTHYKRWQVTGTTDDPQPVPLSERFESKVARADTGCLIWTGAVTGGGYGKLYVQGRWRAATHVAWFLAYGVWPTQFVLHTCDVRPCVDIEHLWEGSALDNSQDAARKGRMSQGCARSNAILNPDLVRIIRERHRDGTTVAQIVRDLPVTICRTSVDAVLTGRTWRSVTPPD